jgi:hypothetical protein
MLAGTATDIEVKDSTGTIARTSPVVVQGSGEFSLLRGTHGVFADMKTSNINLDDTSCLSE